MLKRKNLERIPPPPPPPPLPPPPPPPPPPLQMKLLGRWKRGVFGLFFYSNQIFRPNWTLLRPMAIRSWFIDIPHFPIWSWNGISLPFLAVSVETLAPISSSFRRVLPIFKDPLRIRQDRLGCSKIRTGSWTSWILPDISELNSVELVGSAAVTPIWVADTRTSGHPLTKRKTEGRDGHQEEEKEEEGLPDVLNCQLMDGLFRLPLASSYVFSLVQGGMIMHLPSFLIRLYYHHYNNVNNQFNPKKKQKKIYKPSLN